MRSTLRPLMAGSIMVALWAGSAAAQTEASSARIGSSLAYHFDVRDPAVGQTVGCPAG